MRKLTVGLLAAIALLSTVAATPAVARPRGVNGQIVFGSDMPHGDRERFAAGMLRERHDISDTAKTKILESNPVKFYNLSRF